MIRVDSDEQLGAQTIDVTSLAEIKNLVGVMHYGYQKYTILPDPDNKIVVSGLAKSNAASTGECNDSFRLPE